jgi:hypothetical protein
MLCFVSTSVSGHKKSDTIRFPNGQQEFVQMYENWKNIYILNVEKCNLVIFYRNDSMNVSFDS